MSRLNPRKGEPLAGPSEVVGGMVPLADFELLTTVLADVGKERDCYRAALEQLMTFGRRLMNSEIEDERGIGCCICEAARVIEGGPDA